LLLLWCKERLQAELQLQEQQLSQTRSSRPAIKSDALQMPQSKQASANSVAAAPTRAMTEAETMAYYEQRYQARVCKEYARK
jgi:hypothetical protein